MQCLGVSHWKSSDFRDGSGNRWCLGLKHCIGMGHAGQPVIDNKGEMEMINLKRNSLMTFTFFAVTFNIATAFSEENCDEISLPSELKLECFLGKSITNNANNVSAIKNASALVGQDDKKGITIKIQQCLFGLNSYALTRKLLFFPSPLENGTFIYNKRDFFNSRYTPRHKNFNLVFLKTDGSVYFAEMPYAGGSSKGPSDTRARIDKSFLGTEMYLSLHQDDILNTEFMKGYSESTSIEEQNQDVGFRYSFDKPSDILAHLPLVGMKTLEFEKEPYLRYLNQDLAQHIVDYINKIQNEIATSKEMEDAFTEKSKSTVYPEVKARLTEEIEKRARRRNNFEKFLREMPAACGDVYESGVTNYGSFLLF